MKFEEKIKKLEQIVSEMEKGDLELDKALSSFEEGVKLAKACSKELEEAELKIRSLTGVDSQGNPISEEFSGQD